MSNDFDEHMLTNEQYDELCKRFSYLSSSHCLAWSDLKPALELLNVSLAGHEFRELTGAPQQWVTMDEFAELYARAREMKDNTKMIRKALLLRAVKDVKAYTVNKDSGDTRHSVSKAEERGFTLWINRRLENDPDLCPGILPVDVNKDGQLYDRCTNGILLCKLINVACPNTIDERSINKGPMLKHVFNINENLTLAINSAAALGCCVVNMGPDDIEKKKRHIVLGLIWQLIRKGLVDTITLKQHNELIALLLDGETPEDLLRLKPEELLMRWVNYHLARAGSSRRMTNFNRDVQDSEIYAFLLDQIAPLEKRGKMKSPAEILACSDKERAALVLNNADVLGGRSFLSPEDIYLASESRDRLHIGFLASLFNMYPALDGKGAWSIEGETLEERTYRNWMNSLGVRPFVSYLDIDLSNGLILLQLIDIIKPGTVDWSQVVQIFDPLKKLFQEQGNCNLVVTSARKINIIFVNVSGEDIRERNKKLILGVVFQLMHAYTYKLLHEAVGEGNLMPRDDKEVLQWVNEQLTEAKAKTLRGFRDPALATGVPILQLLEQIRPGSTNKEVWLHGDADDFSLCTYAISCCRKAGARIYALPEHLRDLNGKMIQTILISLQALDFSVRRKAEQAKKKLKKTRLTWLRVDDPDKSGSDSE